jgi:gamma-glutamylcyclotransferase (GGCT)/AIG2-like uncharacterized protein YtfP
MTFNLFVYGTLQSGESNHGRIAKDALGIAPAMVGPARLWTLGTFNQLPFLELGPGARAMPGEPGRIPQDGPGTEPPAGPGLALTAKLMQAHNEDDPTRPWAFIRGEIITLPNDRALIAKLDAFEGFANKDSAYVRTLTWAFLASGEAAPAWVYSHTPGNGWPTRLTYHRKARWGRAL